MKTYNIHVSLVAYSGDDDLILENILCLLNSIPEANITVLENQNTPCSPRTKTLTEIMGVQWKSAPWPTSALSPDEIAYILNEMLSDSENDEDILVKIDPDTALLDARELYEFARSGKALWACGCPNTKIFGNLFALKAGTARYLLENFYLLKQEDETPWDIKIKDFILGLHRNKSKDIFSLWWLSGTLLPWSRFDWDAYPDVSAYKRHAVVTIGDSTSHGFNRELRSEVMRNLRLSRRQ